MDSQSITISFDDIFGGNPENVSIARLESFLEKVVEDTFLQHAQNPNELVRVVDLGGIRWMTAEEADAYLDGLGDADSDKQLRRNIQQALRGDTRILEQEIKVIFLLANNTLKQYRDNHLIPEAEIQRSEPNLIRLGRQVNFQISQLWEIDARVQDLRKTHPILDEFEQKMGELLNLQKNGRHEEAAAIAHELATTKHHYVRLSRGLKSDTEASSRTRLELQRHKKSVLSTHRYLVAQREGVLQEETHDLRESVEGLKVLLQRSAEERRANFALSLEEKSGLLAHAEKELVAVQKEQKVLKKKEDETEQIIEKMESAISPPKEAVAPSFTQPAPAPQPEAVEEPEEPQKARQRMAAIDRRRRE